VTGSSTLFAVHSPRPLIHPAVQNLRHVVDGWIPFTILDCGGMSVAWLKDWLNSLPGFETDFDRVVDLAARAPAGSEGLIFQPYLLGERRRENTGGRGSFLGVTLNHKAEHFARAVMEGVALAMGRDALLFRQLGVKVDRLLCVGGGARNALWSQIKANVVNMPLELADEPEAGIQGAALLAAAGAGLVADPAAEAVSRCEVKKVVAPEPEGVTCYERSLAEFTRGYEHLLGFWQ